jgi:hypothetical protein
MGAKYIKYLVIRAVPTIAVLSAVVLGLSLWTDAVERPKSAENLTSAPSGEVQPLDFSATLVDPEQKAQEQTATVEVKVAGIQLIDPATAHEQPQPGQAHLHYQLDSGPVIATTTTKLSFHELSPGPHKLTVMLAGNDHQLLGPKDTLTMNISPVKTGRAQR